VCVEFVSKPGLSGFAEWTLSFVQEMGVRSDLERGWSTQQNLFLLSSWSVKQRLVLPPSCFVFFVTQTSLFTFMIGLGLKQWMLFFMQFSTVDLSTYKIYSVTRTVCLGWIDLELCIGGRAGNNSQSPAIVQPNIGYVRPISHYDRTWCPNISPTPIIVHP